MQTARKDLCALMRRKKAGNSDGLVILQVDDRLAYGFHKFMDDEQKPAT